MAEPFTILSASGPYREPRELVYSYDYMFQRPTWPYPHAVRVKVSIPGELDVMRQKLLGAVQGTPGQQLVIANLLSRRIADQKLAIANEEGLMAARADVVVPPFTEPSSPVPMASKLEQWFADAQSSLREEIRQRAKL